MRRVCVKRHRFLLLLLLSFVLTACSNEKENSTSKPAAKQDVAQEHKQKSSLEKIDKIKLEVSEETLTSLPLELC